KFALQTVIALNLENALAGGPQRDKKSVFGTFFSYARLRRLRRVARLLEDAASPRGVTPSFGLPTQGFSHRRGVTLSEGNDRVVIEVEVPLRVRRIDAQALS